MPVSLDTSREHAEKLDAADPLAEFRDQFVVADPGLIYLDGNSLGRLPRSAVPAMRRVAEREWGEGLVRSWHEWADLPRRVGDQIATGVLGAEPGSVVVADSTTVNLYKLAAAALDARQDRRVLVTDDDNFPTDLYVLQGLAEARGLQLRIVRTDRDDGLSVGRVIDALDGDVALVSFSHVAYRSGALANMVAITGAAQEAGALALWDLSHSAGSVPIPLAEANVDMAVGCTYKYLCGGPGSPGYLYVRPDLVPRLRQPIWGWFGQSDQFAMGPVYDPVPGVERFTSGTPPVLGLTAVAEGVRVVAEAGIERLRDKGMALTAYLIELADAWLEPLGFRLATPREPVRRGAHVTLHHPRAWQVCQALHDDGVVPDFRSPQRLRLGPAPLTTSYADVWEAMDRLRRLVESERHLPYPEAIGRVT